MSGFFHIPDAFGVLEEKVIPALFEDKSSADCVRVWIAGCTTGEEAYSVAILLSEYALTLIDAPSIEVYATDSDPNSLKIARAGFYGKSIANDMSGLCLQKYFIEGEEGYTVVPEVKAAVHFSSHDVLIDHPFRSFELISARYLLAFIDEKSQAPIVSFFDHSLRPGGFLFLGDVEVGKNLPAHFVVVDAAYQIYKMAEMDGGEEDIPSAEKFEEAMVDPVMPPEEAEEFEEAMAGSVMPPEEAEEFEEAMASSVMPLEEAEESEEETAAPVMPSEEAVDFEEETAVVAMPLEEDDRPANLDLDLLGEFPSYTIYEEEIFEKFTPNVPDVPEIPDFDEISMEKLETGTDSLSSEPGPVENGKSEADRAEEFDKLDAAAYLASGGSLFRVEMGNGVRMKPKEEASAPEEAEASPAVETGILVQLHRDRLMREYVPASVLVDFDFNILDHSDPIKTIFKVESKNLKVDYLDRLSDTYRLKIKEALHQLFFEATSGKIYTVDAVSLDGLTGVSLEMQYLESPDPSIEIAQILFKGHDSSSKAKADDQGGLFPEPPEKAANSGTQSPVEENLLKTIAIAPFPIMAHVEGGHIVAMSQPWEEMAGIKRSFAPTLSVWTKLARGKRLQLKDSKLKESYDDRGVACISIRTRHGDTKLLALHSFYLGPTSGGQKLTLTMAMDITNYPGYTAINVLPESADFGLIAKKAFLANMSHEVRTPLTSMIGFADYLCDQLTGQEQNFARYISESGNRLMETLNTVLRAVSLDGIQPVMKPEMIDIAVEAQGIITMFRPHADQYEIPLKLIVEKPAKARLDRPAFRRILTDLVGNAIKFTLKGEITITVNSDHESVIVKVGDTGTGIGEDFLPFVFDRFTQESKSLARTHSGCGLGLAICKQLVEAMDGTIQVDSESGVGSIFTVRLPKEPLARAGASNPQVSESDSEPEELAKQRILVVEDNTDSQELMLLILRDKYDVSVTSNAEETIQLVNRESFDAILMDLNLGRHQTGFELLPEVRKIKAFENVPVLAVSALPIEVIRKQLIQDGFNGYIAKPFTRARILDALEGLLNPVV